MVVDMLTPEQVSTAAALLLDAHRTNSRIEQLPSGFAPLNFTDAYAIQQAVWQGLGWGAERPISHWKCGCQTPDADRFVAPIYPDRVFENGATVPPTLLHEIAAESEIAYRLGRDLLKRDQPYSEAEVHAAIDAIVVTLEICDSRIHDWREVSFYWQCADNQNSGAMIIGEQLREWQSIDMAHQEAQLWVNGELHTSRVGGNTVVDPFKVMTSAVNQVVERTGAVRAGDLFTAGSWVGTYVVQPGSQVIAKFPGIGEARAHFGRLA